jgi:hypothetical protein
MRGMYQTQVDRNVHSPKTEIARLTHSAQKNAALPNNTRPASDQRRRGGGVILEVGLDDLLSSLVISPIGGSNSR